MALQQFGHAWVTETDAPIYVLQVPAAFEDSTLQAFLDRLDAWVAMATEPYAWVMGSDALLNSKQRKSVAESDKRRAKLAGAIFSAGVAFVVPHAAIRGVLTAILWVAPPSYPHSLFEDAQQALAWAKKQVLVRQMATAATGDIANPSRSTHLRRV